MLAPKLVIELQSRTLSFQQEGEGVGLHLLHKRLPNLAFATSSPQPCDIHRYTLKELVGIVQQEVLQTISIKSDQELIMIYDDQY